VPLGANVLLFPARMKVVCRVPFSQAKQFSGDDLTLEVDYAEIVASRSSKVIPKMSAAGNCPIYSYELEPEYVDCIISEHTL